MAPSAHIHVVKKPAYRMSDPMDRYVDPSAFACCEHAGDIVARKALIANTQANPIFSKALLPYWVETIEFLSMAYLRMSGISLYSPSSYGANAKRFQRESI